MRKFIYSLVAITMLVAACNTSTKKDVEKIKQDSIAKEDSIKKASTVTDIDGNIYHTVTIGTQVWMEENLKVTHYRNGNPIPNVTDNKQWRNLTIGAYCNYNNDSNNSTTYGRLYNWYAINDSRNIAPTGWHVPTDEEWTTLTDYLGGEKGEYVAGGKLKEIGFTGIPSGYRRNGRFEGLGSYGFWWSSTELSNVPGSARYRTMGCESGDLSSDCSYKTSGYSVRCLRD